LAIATITAICRATHCSYIITHSPHLGETAPFPNSQPAAAGGYSFVVE